MTQSDEARFMRRAFVLAERGLNNTASNPRVGQDGSGKWHEFEDGRAERIADSISGCLDEAGCEDMWDIELEHQSSLI